MNQTRVGDWIQTASGRQFWPLDPRPEDVDIRDIAAALSKICRFTGHLKVFYSVASHSVRVCEALPQRLRLLGLLHDAAEAYTGDISRPLKKSVFVHSHDGLAYFSVAEKNLLAVILAAVAPNLRPTREDWEEIHRVDNAALAAEARDLFGSPLHPDWRKWLDGITPLKERTVPDSPELAEREFMDWYNHLNSNGDAS